MRGLITLLILLLLSTCGVYAGNGTAYYDTNIRAPKIGNYQFGLQAFEKPSNEYLPIVDSSYFPKTVATFTTEVNNTAPSATYKSKLMNKVDVVFAVGETAQGKQLQDYIPTFTSMLKSSENYVDAYVEQVKTSTIDMAAFGAKEIFETWRKMPRERAQSVWMLDQANGKVYAEGVKRKMGVHGSVGIIDETPEAFKTQDFTMEFKSEARGPNGESTYWNVNKKGWSNHVSGALFRYTEDALGEFESYAVVIGDAKPGWELPLAEVPFVALIKIRKGSADFTPGTYTNSLFISWSVGVDDYSGRLTTLSTDGWVDYHYPVNQWYPGERGARAESRVLGARAIVDTESHDFKIECTGNNIKVYCGDKLQLNYTDTDSPYTQGTYGLYSFSSPSIYFSNFKITKEMKKTLGDAISDVSWRDGAARFIVHASDIVPDDMDAKNKDDYTATVSKLLNSNAYLINLGNTVNKSALEDVVRKISTADGEVKGTFIENNKPDITTSMVNAKTWIVNKIRGLSKPSDYILVDTLVNWETQYRDLEKDVPLNFGRNTDDIKLAQTWGIALTDLYRGETIYAEKWRYRHDPNYYDNSTVTETWSNIWLPEPISMFAQPGKYRINYKRRDNPLYTDASINSKFDNYRYFSHDYDVIGN